jgi:hypothetical protein
MDDENERLEEDFYQFLNLPRDVSLSFFLSMYVDVLKDACEAKNQNMCYQCVLHMTYFVYHKI